MRRNSLAVRTSVCSSGLRDVRPLALEGSVAGVSGLLVHVDGLACLISVGDRLDLLARDGRVVEAEVVGFHGGLAQTMPFGVLDSLGPGDRVRLAGNRRGLVAVSNAWIGRVIDPLGRPMDRAGQLPNGTVARAVRTGPPEATDRARLGPRLNLGVRALDCFVTCREGQRIGLFSGSGVGKSTLLAMLAQDAACDVVVVALVGERGREVREFLEDDLGADGRARAVVVVATSDAPPLLRRQAGYTAMAVAEHFRDQGKSVLLLMDSVTRFCLASREIGLSAGEPPATRGYPPSVFAELPRLLERAGPGPETTSGPAGQITALFTVLVEGDDHNEPVADSVRGILDGHVILDRRVAEGGRYPAVDVLRSLSRSAASCLTPDEISLVRRARSILALHGDMSDLVRLGAYHPGADPAVDEAVRLAPRIESMLRQDREERTTSSDSFAILRAALNDCTDGT